MSPAFSPDGRYVAYVSDETGELEVYVRSYPDSERKWAISSSGGREPVWSRDGNSLFYRNGGEMWEVPIQTEPEFRAGVATLLFDQPYAPRSGPTATVPDYDVSADGQSFLMLRHSGDSGLTEVRVILNWAEELERLAPSN